MHNRQLNAFELVSILPEAVNRLAKAVTSPTPEIAVDTRKATRRGVSVGVFNDVVTPESNARIRQWMEAARTNDSIDQAVLRINSPGGFVEGTAETFEFGLRLRKEKQFTVLAEGCLCSGAFHISASATKVFASPSTIVGSIGVISILVDETQMFDDMGIKIIPISTGQAKADGFPGVPVTEEMKSRVQKLVQESVVAFQKDIKRAGRMTAEQREFAIETAGVFHAPEAKQRGLIDDIVIPEDFFSDIEQLARSTRFIDLEGLKAADKLESLICNHAKVEHCYLADDEDIEEVRQKYPELAEKSDDYYRKKSIMTRY